MQIQEFLSQQVQAAMVAAGAPSSCPAVLSASTRPEFGDFQANGAMAAAKLLKQNPRQLAEKIVENLNLDGIADKLEIAGPGFINIHLNLEWLGQQLQQQVQKQELFSTPNNTPETIVVDYSSPNLAKEMHVGHLRSSIIGDAVVRVLEQQGHKVIRQNHVGDWGTQFGMLIAHLEDQTEQQNIAQSALADLENFYRAAKVRFDTEDNFADKARSYVVKLQSGDTHCLQLWQKFIDISIAHSEAIYQQLNVSLKPEHIKAESAYNSELPKVIQALESQSLLTKDQGAQVAFLKEVADKDGNPLPIIVQKSDGGYLYATTDLAALKYRCQELNADRILYFIDARQSLHMKQVFALGKKAGFSSDTCKLEHHPFGTMMGSDNKPFKTRSGDTIKLADLLDEAITKAAALLTEKGSSLNPEQQKEAAQKIGIGAIKYADLSKKRTNDYVFNWDSMLSFEGNTAPYLQYAYTRIQSIFRKAEVDAKTLLEQPFQIEASTEKALALLLLRFNACVATVAEEGYPHLLCTYLYELARLFMHFYEHCPILKADVSMEQRVNRLKLSALTADALKTGLNLLGIEVMDVM